MLVSCEEELKTALESSESILLEDDIYLSEEMRTYSEFSGIFDGDGYTIYNLQTQIIHTLRDDAILRNVVFEGTHLQEDMSIIGMNNGRIKSVVVKDFKTKFRSVLSGILVKLNHSTIQGCTVSEGVLYGDVAGGICGRSTKGEITNCVVSNVKIRAGTNVGGICGESSSTDIYNCQCTDSEVFGENATGGICGRAGSCDLHNNDVSNVQLYTGYSVAGIVSRVSEQNTIKNCHINNSKLSALGQVNGICASHTQGETISCSMKNCEIDVFQSDSLVSLFSSDGIVQSCFVEDININGIHIDLFVNDIEIINSLAKDISITADSVNDEIQFTESDSFFASVQYHTESDFTGEVVNVYSSKDLCKIDRYDTVELHTDINLEKNPMPVKYFEGDFNGNGHTIHNLHGVLFEYISGSVKNIHIESPYTDDLMRSSIIAHSATNSKFKNITVESDKPVEKKYRFAGFVENGENNRYLDCNITLCVSSKYCGVYGFSEFATECVFIDCAVDVDFECSAGSGFAKYSNSSEFNKCASNGMIVSQDGSIGGFIESASDSTIKNCVSKINLSSCSTNTNDNIGGFCGNTTVDTSVKNSIFSGSITVDEFGFSVGGFVGTNDGKIIECKNKADITTYSECTGGIAGKCEGVIRKCSNKGIINGGQKIGGIIGSSNGYNTTLDISSCQNKGMVSGKDSVGGLIGSISTDINVTITNCYTLPTITGKSNSDLFIGSVASNAKIDVSNLYWIDDSTSEYSSEYGTSTSLPEDKLTVVLQI